MKGVDIFSIEKDPMILVLKNLPIWDVISFGSTCKQALTLTHRQSLWRQFMKRDFDVLIRGDQMALYKAQKEVIVIKILRRASSISPALGEKAAAHMKKIKTELSAEEYDTFLDCLVIAFDRPYFIGYADDKIDIADDEWYMRIGRKVLGSLVRVEGQWCDASWSKPEHFKECELLDGDKRVKFNNAYELPDENKMITFDEYVRRRNKVLL